jgi:predicted membrane GTPase involved in stress response
LIEQSAVKKIFKDVALVWNEFQEANAGELVSIAGLESSNIGNTICFEAEEMKLI